MTARHALYLVPARTSALWRFGCAWLGRDPEDGSVPDPPAVEAVAPARRLDITAEPRRYGFHATLKPPMRLADGRDAAELEELAAAFAAAEPALGLPPLRLAAIAGFLALVPAAGEATVATLAARVVTAFDAFRAPPDPRELDRRRAGGRLTPREEQLLERWGYPYVMEAFRFHMTLTGRLAEAERATVLSALAPVVEGPAGERPPAELALFVEDAPGLPFRLVRRFPLGQPGTVVSGCVRRPNM